MKCPLVYWILDNFCKQYIASILTLLPALTLYKKIAQNILRRLVFGIDIFLTQFSPRTTRYGLSCGMSEPAVCCKFSPQH